jgi:putative ABC transport system permease protein
MPLPRRPATLPRPTAELFRALLPHAERDEVLDGLAAEFVNRARTDGDLWARLWLWRQLFGSLPALLRRTWWRGCTGFEPRANRMHPGGPMLESWIMDARYAVRRLVSRPTYTFLAVLTLALGAGGTAAIFSMARPLLFDPLPIAREAEVGMLWHGGSWTEQEFLYIRPDFPGFRNVAAYRHEGATLEIPNEPIRLVEGLASSAELFEVLGAGAFIGRTFQRGDDVPGAEPVVVLSHAMWQQLGGDASIVGSQLMLGGANRTVVGVMPRGFWFPNTATRVWLARPLNPERQVGELQLIGRIAEGHRIDAMEAPLQAIAARLGARFTYPDPQWDKTRAPEITPAREHLIGDVRPGVVATFVAMALILLIACVNVAALMLGQMGGRSAELAVRTALGAGRRRLLQQLVIEALLIGAMAGAAGALFAAVGFDVLTRSLPLGAVAEAATLNWTLLWAATLIAVIAASAIAVVPGVALWRANLHGRMGTTRTGGITVRGGQLESGLVIAQIALAVLLAAGAGLLMRSVTNLRGIDTGVDLGAVAVVDVTAPTRMSPDERRRAYLQALPSLQGLPGVRAAAVTQRLPLRGSSDNWGLDVEGKPDLPSSTTAVRVVSHEYFQTLGIHIRQGRGFLPTDHADTGRVVVINEALAAKYFPNEDPLGRVLRTGFDDRGERIIGVVDNVAETELTDVPGPARYMLYEHVGNLILPGATFVLRATAPAEVPALMQAARGTIERDAPQLAVNGAMTLQAVFDEAMGPAGQVVTLVSLLAVLALVLGAIGVYGVISHFVTRRARDYGVCMALGLAPSRVLLQVVGRGVTLVAAGGAIGVLAAMAMTGLLSSLLYGVGATDPVALAGAVLALMIVGAVAAFVPARRASLTDPATVLRQQ